MVKRMPSPIVPMPKENKTIFEAIPSTIKGKLTHPNLKGYQ